ncbi:MAG: head GIN domain-containing protein [Cyclobacteriaceae bacterium]
MKKSLSLLFVALISLGSAFAQNRETRSVAAFSKISFRVPGKLVLRQGSPQKVEIEGDKETLSKIETEVKGDRLSIGNERWNWGWSSNDRVMVYITVKDISALSVSGSGDLITEGKIITNKLDLNVSGSGSLQTEASVSGDMEANVSGSGRIDVKGSCESLESDISGSGRVNASLTILRNIAVDISGSGKFEGSGSAKEIKTEISGSGKVFASNLEVDICNVRISGSGDVEINVKSELDANISGSGTVSYKGNPSHVNGHSSGSGKVRKM